MSLFEKETIIDHEDITVLNSYVEYDGNKKLKYLLYEMSVKDKNGEIKTLYKAIKLLRVIRLPKAAKQETKFMDIHSEFLGGMWERRANVITVIANILSPVPVGLIFCYGVQAVSDNVDDAKNIADSDFSSLCAGLQGAYRTMEFKDLSTDEIEWLRDKMSTMKNLSMVRGLPAPRKAPGEGGNSGFGGRNINPDTQETTEEFVAGLSDKEYIVLMISTPVEEDVLNNWLTIASRENTKWQAQLQGSQGINFGVSIPMVFMGNLGAAEGWSEGFSDGESVGTGHTDTVGHSITESFGENSSHSSSTNIGENQGINRGISHSDSQNLGVNSGENYGINQGYNEGISTGKSHGENSNFGTSESMSNSVSHGKGISESMSTGSSHSTTHSSSQGVSNNWAHSIGNGTSGSKSWNSSKGYNEGVSHGDGQTAGGGFKAGPVGGNGGYNASNGQSMGDNYSSGRGGSVSNSFSESFSNSGGKSNSVSSGYSDSMTFSQGRGVSQNWSESSSRGVGKSWGAGVSDGSSINKNVGISEGYSKGISHGSSAGVGQSDGYTAGASAGISRGLGESTSYGTSHTMAHGNTVSSGDSVSWGRNHGNNFGFNGALNSGISASMGFGPSLGFNRTFQFIDIEVRNIVQIYEFNTDRLMQALNGNGAFFVDMYLATPDKDTQAAATNLAKSAWQNENAYFCPLQILDLEGEEKDHMFYHFAAFSACNTQEGLKGSMLSYKYSTILLPSELTAYTHPVRLSEGGQYADIEDLPTLAVPSMMQGEIYLGKVLSSERWTRTSGYKTPFDYRLDGSSALHHAIFTGESRSGKTVAATRFIVEAAIKTKRFGKRLRIIVLDPKQDWRVLGKFIEAERFRFYSLGDPDFLPIKFNLLKIPVGVRPQVYADGIIEGFCRAYQLGEKVKPILRDAIYSAYNELGCFGADWKEVAPELSKQVTFPLIYQRIRKKMDDLKAMKASFNIIEAYERLLDRLDMFGKEYTTEYMLFGCGGEEGLSIDQILGADDVIVLESYGLDPIFKSFVFGQIVTGIWQYCYGHPKGFKADDEYSTVLVIEEANEVLIGQSGKGKGDSTVQGTSMFEKIVDQAAGLELFIIAVTQKIAEMPQSIIANAGLLFTLKISRAEDKDVVMEKIGKDPKLDDKPLRKFFPKMPTGWAICKSGRTFDYKEAEAVLVAVDRLDVEPPNDEELENIMALRTVKTIKK